jgi:hypothetical protein
VGASFRWRQVKVWGETVNREMRAWSEGMKRNPPNTTFRVLRPHKVTASVPSPSLLSCWLCVVRPSPHTAGVLALRLLGALPRWTFSTH